jgi:DNA-nicking Smr family endonuclease
MMQKQTIEITAPARKPKQTQTSDGNNGPMVIDLHASEVLETTAGLSNAEILNYQLDIFRKTIEEFKAKKGMKIVFIHGKGEGVLRNAIIKELRYRYKSFTYQDASFQEYGYGATQVTIH